MALTRTTLAAAIADEKTTSFTVTSATGFAAGNMLRVNDEFLLISGVDGTRITAQRGFEGTIAKAHGILSVAVVGPRDDFSADLYPPRVYTYGTDGAITPRPGLHRLAKATAATAMTLAAPAADQEGERLIVIATTAAAHVITTASGTYFNAATNNTCTYGGAIGDFVELMAVNGSWDVLSYKNVTLSAV